MLRAHDTASLRPSPSRFCDGRYYAVLYAALDFETAFMETAVRDRFVGAGRRVIALDEVLVRRRVEYAPDPIEPLRLVDLRDEGCLRLGAATDAAHARNHAVGRALSRARYDTHRHVDAFCYKPRLTGDDCFAIFDRAAVRLTVTTTQGLLEHPDLPAVLVGHLIVLER